MFSWNRRSLPIFLMITLTPFATLQRYALGHISSWIETISPYGANAARMELSLLLGAGWRSEDTAFLFRPPLHVLLIFPLSHVCILHSHSYTAECSVCICHLRTSEIRFFLSHQSVSQLAIVPITVAGHEYIHAFHKLNTWTSRVKCTYHCTLSFCHGRSYKTCPV